MLQFVLGRAGTGKTTTVWQAIRARAAAGRRCLLVVPEQFASTADLTGYRQLGDALHSQLKVCSFSTLTGMIEARYGGGALRSISDAGRMVLMRRTLAQLGEDIVYFARSRRSARFCADCADTLQQLKYCGVAPQLLEQAAAAAGRDRGRRLAELAVIYRAYEQARDATGLEQVDRLSRAAMRVQDAFFEDIACFVDCFGEFTAPEMALLQRMLAAAPEVTVTLTCPSLNAQECAFTPFAPAAATGRHLAALAAQAGVTVAVPVVLTTGHRYTGAGLAAVEQQLSGLQAPLAAPAGRSFMPPAAALPMEAAEGVLYHAAADLYGEACFAAARMVMLARQGVPWHSMVVVVRDVAAYLPALQYACGLYDIPLFTGSTLSAEYAPLSVFLRAALGLAKGGLTGDGVLTLLKTGLAGAAEDALSALENYVYTWRPKADDWRAPFTRNPSGADAMEMNESEARQLELAEGLRSRIVPIIEQFRAARGKTGRQLSEALYRLLIAVGAEDVVLGWAAQEAGQGLGGFDSLRMWQTVVGFLDQMAELLGDEEIKPAEYDDLLCVLLRNAEIGQAPHIQDQVQLAAADSMRLDAPEHIFVLGLAEGHFPAPIGDSPLLTNDDRRQLSELGAPLSGDFGSMVLREQMNLYRALTGAARSLTLTRPAAGSAGPMELSAPVKQLVQALGIGACAPTPIQLAQTPAAALELLAAGYREDTPDMAALRTALAALPEMAGRLQALDTAAGRQQLGLQQPQVLRQLLGRTVRVNPSKVENYYRCPFMYFMEDILKVKPRPRAELGIPQSGTLVHWVLEQLLGDLQAFAALDDAALEARVRGEIRDYVAQHLPGMESHKMEYMMQRLGDNALLLLQHIRDELAQSRFVPIALEQRIGEGGVPALRLQGSHGQQVQITGSVDRVDAMVQDGRTYLRVVDYKTGSKTFSLDEVCCGLDTQMLLYLMALVRGGDGVLPVPAPYTPAGVLYQISDPAPSAEQGAADFEVVGLLLNEEAVLTGSDRECSGLYLPCKPDARNSEEKLVSMATMQRIAQLLEQLVTGMADSLYEGGIEPVPLRCNKKAACDYCNYRLICRHKDGEQERQMEKGSWKQLLATEEAENTPREVSG